MYIINQSGKTVYDTSKYACITKEDLTKELKTLHPALSTNAYCICLHCAGYEDSNPKIIATYDNKEEYEESYTLVIESLAGGVSILDMSGQYFVTDMEREEPMRDEER